MPRPPFGLRSDASCNCFLLPYARLFLLAVPLTAAAIEGETGVSESLTEFDLVQVSPNVESEEKYNAICRPKFSGTFTVAMSFLHHFCEFVDGRGAKCRVELTVVDTSETEFLPPASAGRLARSRTSQPANALPHPSAGRSK
jgi:hypothetical protein